jgi:TetR/AcrR family transcriptional regulator
MTKPATPDPAAREAILAASAELFSAQGYAGTTIKEIAGKAGVNSALLYYYFEDKEGLYRAVLAHLMGSVSQAIGGSMAEAPSPEEGVRRFVLAQSGAFTANRAFAKLLLRELMDHGAVRLEVPISTVIGNAFRPLAAQIAAGQQAGIFRRDLDVRFAVLSIVAQVAYFTLAQPLVAQLMGHDGTVPVETARAFGGHAADWAIRALKA